jgi:hypothetical protein
MTTGREGLLRQIRGLLAKTVEHGCTEEEALSALSNARAKMDAYAVTESELNLTKEEKAVLRREPPDSKDPHRIKRLLATAVARFCGCQGWREGQIIAFCGLRSDAQFATWLLDTLTAFVQSELAAHLMDSDISDRRDRREAIKGFVIGITERISERLNQLCVQSAAAAKSNGTALVVVKAAAVQAKLDELGIVLRMGRGLCGGGDSSSYEAGRAAGNRAGFGRPVSGRNATPRLN